MMQVRPNSNYNIQQVSNVTGLSKQVIRKWEERYDLIQPERLDNGYRVYSEEDIKKLLKVKVLSEKGYSLKQAVAQVLEEKQLDYAQVELPIEKESSFPEFNDFVFKLLEHGTDLDEIELTYTLQQAYFHYGLESFLDKVVLPFLLEVGNRWEKEEWDEYQEAVSSMIVRDFLVQIRRNFHYRDDAPLVIGCCLPHETHEIPVHILLLQFMMKGWKSFLVGASPAPGAIESMVEKLKPQKVLLSASTSIPFERNPKLLTGLDQFAENHKEIKFYIGGAGAMQYFACKNLKNISLANSINEVLD
ncbi:MAG: MerR family transcriptional regulator [Psychrobacillus sp.]